MGPEHSLGLDRIVSAVTPGVAPQQAPPREHQAPKYAVLPHRVDRVSGARRLVLAAPRDRRRDQSLVDDDRRQRRRRGPPGAARSQRPLEPSPAGAWALIRPPPRAPAAPRRAGAALRRAPRCRPALPSSSVSAASRPASPSRSASSSASGRATTTTSWPARRPGSLRANASRSSRLTLLRWTAPPTFRETDRPTRGRSGGGVREAVEDELPVGGRAARAGTRARTPRCARGGRCGSAPPRSSAVRRRRRPSSRRKPLASLVAPALERHAAGARAHPCTETVHARALSLLRLVGALHLCLSMGPRLCARHVRVCPPAPRRGGSGASQYRRAGAAPEFSRQLRDTREAVPTPLGIVARPGPRGGGAPSSIVDDTPWEGRIGAAVSRELEHIWSRVQAQLATVVDEPTYRLWLSDLRPIELVGERLVIEAPPQTLPLDPRALRARDRGRRRARPRAARRRSSCAPRAPRPRPRRAAGGQSGRRGAAAGAAHHGRARSATPS